MSQTRINPEKLAPHGVADTAQFVNNPPETGDLPKFALAGEQIMARQRVKPGTDEMTITDSMRVQLGIKPDLPYNPDGSLAIDRSESDNHETVGWFRNEEDWRGVMGTLSLSAHLDATGGRMITQKDSKGNTVPVRKGDLVLCAYPGSLKVVTDEQKLDQMEKYLRDTQEGDFRQKRYRNTNEELEELRDFDKQQIVENALVGEWAGQRAEDVMHALGESEVRRIMSEYRGGGGEDNLNKERAEEFKARQQEARRDSGSGKFMSIPATVGSKNHAGSGAGRR